MSQCPYLSIEANLFNDDHRIRKKLQQSSPDATLITGYGIQEMRLAVQS
jgi:hypothetical protein